MVDHLLQKIRPWHEIRVKDRDELAFHRRHRLVQRSRFESVAIHPVPIFDIKTFRRQFLGEPFAQFRTLIRRVIQYLDLQFVLRIIQRRYGCQQPLSHVHFVEQRQLNCHPG